MGIANSGEGSGTVGDGGPLGAELRPSVHPTYARLIATELRRRGFSDEKIFEGTRLDWKGLLEDDRFLSFQQFRRTAKRGMELTKQGSLGLDVAYSTQISAHGPVGYAMVASCNVAQTLEVIEQYSSLRLEIARFEIERHQDRVRLHIDSTVPWGDVTAYTSAHIVGSVCLLLETVSGGRLPDTRIALAHPPPAWSTHYATRLQGVGVAFDAEACVVDLPSSFLSTPCITSDETAFRQALRMCERAAAQRKSGGDLAQRVLERLLDRHGDYPSSVETAKALGMSNRSLIRKLKAQGTSYQALLDDVRQELAIWYLRQTTLSVERIAERLGYHDTSNFSRTCKRWFGLTPSAIRRE